MIYMHWVPTEQTVNKEYYVEVLREFRKRFRRERLALFKLGQWHFLQDNATVHNFHPYHRLFDQDGHRDGSSASLQSRPSSLWLLVIPFSSQAVVMRQLRRWKRLWRRSLTRSHRRTSMGPCRSCWNSTTSALQPKEITSKGNRVSCVYYQ